MTHILAPLNSPHNITMTSQWTRLRLKSPASPVFTQSFIRAQMKKKHQSSVSLAFVWGIHRGPVNSPHKWPVTRKMLPFDDVVMKGQWCGSWCFFDLGPHVLLNKQPNDWWFETIWLSCDVIVMCHINLFQTNKLNNQIHVNYLKLIFPIWHAIIDLLYMVYHN